MSEGLRRLQAKCGCTPDGSFGPNTARGIMKYYEMSPERTAHFLGQVVVESMNFQAVEENLNYSVDALMRYFGRYFDNRIEAKAYSRNPRALANYVYMDKNRTAKSKLGNVHPNDGFNFRGRGFVQVTGRANVEKFAKDMVLPEVVENPDLIATEYPMESAIWYFNSRRGLWKLCDGDVTEKSCREITKKVNGGYNHVKERTAETFKIYGWVK